MAPFVSGGAYCTEMPGSAAPMPSNDDAAAGAAAPEVRDCTAVSGAPVVICGMPPCSRSFLVLIAFPWSLSFRDLSGAETSFFVDYWITVAPVRVGAAVSAGSAAAVTPADATRRRRMAATMAVTLRMRAFSFNCGSTCPAVRPIPSMICCVGARYKIWPRVPPIGR